jgi:hypothetical protein
VELPVGKSIEQAPAVTIMDKGQILDGIDGWEGPADLSFSARSAVKDGKLLVRVDVTDDVISNQSTYAPQHNDSVFFFYDVRPANQQGRLGPGTGALALVLPAEGNEVAVSSTVKGLEVPPGLEVQLSRREGGYVLDISVPLASLGLAEVSPGRLIRLDIQVNDRDNIKGLAPVTRMFLIAAWGKQESSRGYGLAVLP